MKEKMDKFMEQLEVWRVNGMKGRKPKMSLTFEEVLEAPYVTPHFQGVAVWYEYLKQGGNLDYKAWSYRDGFIASNGNDDYWEESYQLWQYASSEENPQGELK